MRAAAPWLLPVRIHEGPLVQMPTTDAATLIWYTTRPATCEVIVDVDGQSQTFPAIADGTRQRADLTGLQPGHTYPYRIATSSRALTDNLALQTVRAPGQAFNFIVFGDSGRGSQGQFSLAAEMARLTPAPDFLVHAGDIIYASRLRAHYADRFFTPYRHLLPRIGFWPCPGNHEFEDGRADAYQEVFELPANGPEGLPADFNYWFDYASARFAMIDSNADEATLAQRVAPWLRQVMSEPGPRWKFAVLHHPPYTGGKYAPDQRIQRALVPTFETVGIDVVFSGHDHNYQRTHPLRGGQIVAPDEGIVYIITGAGGATLYQPAATSRPTFTAAADHEHHSFTHVAIDGGTLRMRQVTIGGDVLDEWRLEKSPPATISATPPPTTAPAPPGHASSQPTP